MKRLFLILISFSVASDLMTDISVGVSRYHLFDPASETIESFDVVFPVLVAEGSISYPVGEKLGAALSVKYGGPAKTGVFEQLYDVSGKVALTYKIETISVQIGPVYQKTKMKSISCDDLQDCYIDYYGISLGVYQPISDYYSYKVNFQQLVSNESDRWNSNASSNPIGLFEAGVTQLSLSIELKFVELLN